MKVELDKRSLFALASDTRLEILKSLHSNRRTVCPSWPSCWRSTRPPCTATSRSWREGGFVVRTEDHGFVYYALTWKSRDILEPNDRTRIVILISSALVCLLAMVIVAFMAAQPSGTLAESIDRPSGALDDAGEPTRGGAAPAATLGMPVMAILGASAVALSALAWRLWRRPRQIGGETASDAPGHIEP
jgi:hypothetical protein